MQIKEILGIFTKNPALLVVFHGQAEDKSFELLLKTIAEWYNCKNIRQ
jgi:hypothetical protein